MTHHHNRACIDHAVRMRQQARPQRYEPTGVTPMGVIVAVGYLVGFAFVLGCIVFACLLVGDAVMSL